MGFGIPAPGQDEVQWTFPVQPRADFGQAHGLQPGGHGSVHGIHGEIVESIRCAVGAFLFDLRHDGRFAGLRFAGGGVHFAGEHLLLCQFFPHVSQGSGRGLVIHMRRQIPANPASACPFGFGCPDGDGQVGLRKADGDSVILIQLPGFHDDALLLRVPVHPGVDIAEVQTLR